MESLLSKFQKKKKIKKKLLKRFLEVQKITNFP